MSTDDDDSANHSLGPTIPLPSLEYEDPDEAPPERRNSEYADTDDAPPVRRNSFDVAALAPGQGEFLVESTIEELAESLSTILRRNSFDVSFMRSTSMLDVEEERLSTNSTESNASDRHRQNNAWGTRPLRVSINTIQRHTRTVHLNAQQLAATSHQNETGEEEETVVVPVFTVPEYDEDGREVEMDHDQEQDESDHHPRRHHLAVTFGAYHDDHNDEVIPELVQVDQSEELVPLNQRREQEEPYVKQGKVQKGADIDKTPLKPHHRGPVRRLQELLAEASAPVQVVATNLACLFTHAILRAHPELDVQLVTMILVTLCGATFPHMITSVACGVYAGSVSPDTLSSFGWVVLLGILTSVVWQVVSVFKLMLGLGGRLGASAFVAMNLTALLADHSLSFASYGPSGKGFNLEEAMASTAACIFLASTSGYMRLPEVAQVPVNPVLLPSAWALFCILATSLVDYQFNPSVYGGYAVGAYVGMSSVAKLSSSTSFAMVGLVAGVWMQLLRPVCLGFGGKSGFTAMLGVVTYELTNKGCKYVVGDTTPPPTPPKDQKDQLPK